MKITTNVLMRDRCPLRNSVGRCSAFRANCNSVTQDICDALQQAYAQGRFERTDDMIPVRRGHWISYADLHSSCCSECNAWWIPWGEGYKETYRYCPNCGAKMDLLGSRKEELQTSLNEYKAKIDRLIHLAALDLTDEEFDDLIAWAKKQG